MIKNDFVIFGLLMALIFCVFEASNSKKHFFKRFFNYVPELVICYFAPSILTMTGIIDVSSSSIYKIVINLLLPAALILLTMTIDVKELLKLGKTALIMFSASAISIMFGGPLAILVFKTFSSSNVDLDNSWRGLATLAGTWIGGGANQTALKEVFKPSDEIFSAILTVDALVAYVWMAILLILVKNAPKIDGFLKADASTLEEVKTNIAEVQKLHKKQLTLHDFIRILGIAFIGTGLAHFLADLISPFVETHFPNLVQFGLSTPFFWIVSISSTIGILLSFTKLKNLEGAGSSHFATGFIYIMAASIGLKMNILAIFDHLELLYIAILWMLFHIVIIFIVAKITKSSFFFIAVGSQACIGGPASAPVVAAAFHPSLASVGVIMAIMGYAFGTYMGLACGIMMQWVVNF
jgi:uncharacterized membrane protein